MKLVFLKRFNLVNRKDKSYSLLYCQIARLIAREWGIILEED